MTKLFEKTREKNLKINNMLQTRKKQLEENKELINNQKINSKIQKKSVKDAKNNN